MFSRPFSLRPSATSDWTAPPWANQSPACPTPENRVPGSRGEWSPVVPGSRGGWSPIVPVGPDIGLLASVSPSEILCFTYGSTPHLRYHRLHHFPPGPYSVLSLSAAILSLHSGIKFVKSPNWHTVTLILRGLREQCIPSLQGQEAPRTGPGILSSWILLDIVSAIKPSLSFTFFSCFLPSFSFLTDSLVSPILKNKNSQLETGN